MTPEYANVVGESKLSPKAIGALSFTAAEWWRLGALYGIIATLHIVGWGLYLHYSAKYPALIGLGIAAYLFGLRHAFDADHIAAIDDTVRFLVQRGKRPLAVGFFFSLGHSTIVLALAIAISVATMTMKDQMPYLRDLGGVIGLTVSGVFLWIIGILNLLVLLDILKVWRQAKDGRHNHHHLEELLSKRGLLNRLLGSRFERVISDSWQLYPVGMLFGLGFDTASEIGLLAMTAGASTGDLPLAAVLALPILFAAGMTALDTTDGVLMVKAYNWAFINPLQKIFYNLTITSLSVGVALIIGTIQLLQVLIGTAHLDGPFFQLIAGVDLGTLGYMIVGIFVAAWLASTIAWNVGQRYGKHYVLHAHQHRHASGKSHSHRHFH